MGFEIYLVTMLIAALTKKGKLNALFRTSTEAEARRRPSTPPTTHPVGFTNRDEHAGVYLALADGTVAHLPSHPRRDPRRP